MTTGDNDVVDTKVTGYLPQKRWYWWVVTPPHSCLPAVR